MDTDTVALAEWSYSLAAGCYFLLSAYLLSLGKQWRTGPRAKSMLLAIVLGATWSTLTLTFTLDKQPVFIFLGTLAELLQFGAWYAFIILVLHPGSIFSRPEKPIAAWIFPSALLIISSGIVLFILLALGILSPERWIRPLMFHALGKAVFGLILLEQLFRNVTDDSRWNIKPLCLGLATQYIFDIYLFSDALMFNQIDPDASAVRAFVHTITLPLFFIATLRSRDWTSKIRLSQKAVFHSATLLIAGLYLLFMSGIGYYVRYFGSDWGKAFQLGLAFAALLGLGMLVVSGSMRAKLRVLVGKHFFTYRYDYREEWLRFTKTLATQNSPQAMGQQVIRGLADMVESPAGALWLREGGRDRYAQTARWNLPECDVQELPDSPLVQFLISSGWVINLEEYRCYPGRYGELQVPTWLSNLPDAWLVVPLMVGSEMYGFIVLASARTQTDVNWEVNDLLRTAGCQAASFLANMQATEALLEVRKFDAFNKMSAFVVHDLKNIITQLSLMLKNAERHRDNPEFQKDMLMTVENSVERMRQLMMQLREGATPPGAACGVNLPVVIYRIQKEKLNQGRVVDVDISESLSTRGHEERLERVLGHLIQNALDATPNDGKVWVRLDRQGDRVQLEIGDTGHGMNQEFVRERLFRPFQTTKESGMGIGAYESAQYIKELGGDIAVESEPGAGTRILLILPLFSVNTDSDLRERATA